MIRLHFDEPLTIKRIQLHFVEGRRSGRRSLRCMRARATELREVVRQQWTSRRSGTTEEIEDYGGSERGDGAGAADRSGPKP